MASPFRVNHLLHCESQNFLLWLFLVMAQNSSGSNRKKSQTIICHASYWLESDVVWFLGILLKCLAGRPFFPYPQPAAKVCTNHGDPSATGWGLGLGAGWFPFGSRNQTAATKLRIHPLKTKAWLAGKSPCSIGNTSTHSWCIFQPVMLVFAGDI